MHLWSAYTLTHISAEETTIQLISYNMFTVHCLFTSQDWQRQVERSRLSGISGPLSHWQCHITASTPLGWLVAGVTREAVTTRQQGGKLQWLHTAWSDHCLLRPINSLASCGHVVVVGRVIIERRVITTLLLSVDTRGDSIQAYKRPTPSSSHAMPCMFGCSVGYIPP